jgi:2-polyprenyl-3-methyl-5-hydroxy-6-metoxy-1,4-benzoquinol methylase
MTNTGYCAICMSETTFITEGPWLRDQYKCRTCHTIPRQRAVVDVLNLVRPDWRALAIHESSPSMWFFRGQCRDYSFSYFFEGVPRGGLKDGIRCEDLEDLTFPDETFDIFITQDVLEHVFHPDRALKEISRVLRLGGMHVFTTPKHKSLTTSYARARIDQGQITHVHEPQYHGNPVSARGSLVTWDYGADLDDLLQGWSGYSTSNFIIRDRRRGIDGEHLDVFVTVKDPVNALPVLEQPATVALQQSTRSQPDDRRADIAAGGRRKRAATALRTRASQCRQMSRNEIALQHIDRAGRGLEIGPSYRPLIPKSSGARIEVVDHADREELVAKYRSYGLDSQLLASIEAVDYVWNRGSLLDVVPDRNAYDYVLASHFIEHTVDLIGFLRDCESLLVNNGRLALVIPDKRYCFDRFQPLSSIGAVIDAHYARSSFHPAESFIDHQAYACKRGEGTIAWGEADRTPLGLQFPNLEGTTEVIERALRQESYTDIHRWRFIPESFELLIHDLRFLGYHNMAIVGSEPTIGHEFFVTLGKEIPLEECDRLRTLMKIEAELALPAAQERDDAVARRRPFNALARLRRDLLARWIR